MAAEYPTDSKSYNLIAEIGSGVSGMVYKAICLTMPPSSSASTVAIKCIDVDESRADFDSETKTMSLLNHNHPNILRAHCSFPVDRGIWVVMPFMSAGSVQSIITSNFPTGLPEDCIAMVLMETLKALMYLHNEGHVHGNVKPGNILVDSDGVVKLSYLGGVSDANFDSSRLKEVGATPYLMAPELVHSGNGYGVKADIWSFGITALELAQGRHPLSLPPSKSLLLKIITKQFQFSANDDRGGGSTSKGEVKKEFSELFEDMVGLCLTQDPGKRPTAAKLLEHGLFKNIESCGDILVKSMLVRLPSVEERFKLGELVISEMEKLRLSSSPASIEQVRAVGRVEWDSQESREELIGVLVAIRDSLDAQVKDVEAMMRIVGGDESGGEEINREEEEDEEVERLKTELEQEKRNNKELLLHLEDLKLILYDADGSQQDET